MYPAIHFNVDERRPQALARRPEAEKNSVVVIVLYEGKAYDVIFVAVRQ